MTLSPHYALPISLQDNAGVQPAGKSQHNPIDLVAHLFIFPSMEPPQRAHSARLTGAADTCNRGMVLNGKGLPPQPEGAPFLLYYVSGVTQIGIASVRERV